MRHLPWFFTALFLFSLPFAAEAQFPKPRPAAAPAAAQTPAPTPPAAQAPTEVAAPSVVVAAPTTLEDVRAWINTTLLGLLTSIGGWIGIRGVKTAAPGASPLPAGVADVLAKLKDPTTVAGLETMGLKLIQTGAPGQILQTVAGLAPGGASVAAVIEPMLRDLGVDALQKLIAKHLAEGAPHA